VSRRGYVICQFGAGIADITSGHPVDEERVDNREHHGTDEQPDHTEGDEPADHTGKDQQQRPIAPSPRPPPGDLLNG